MQNHELKSVLGEIKLSQTDFSRLLGVTPRAVTLWLAGERAVPGPVDAYLRLFQLLPPSLRQIELNRLKEKGPTMRDGMYGITFSGQFSTGDGVLIFDNGRIYGSDSAGVSYDGGYIYDASANAADVKVKVTFPPNVRAVFGISNPYEWSFDVTTRVSSVAKAGALSLKSSLGQPIAANFVYLRALPDAA